MDPLKKISKIEATKLLIQSLRALNYNDAADNLEKESGIKLHSEIIEKLRQSALNGDWDQVMSYLLSQEYQDLLGINASRRFTLCTCENRIFVEILQQKYYQLLASKNYAKAVDCLRNELGKCIFSEKTILELSACLMNPNFSMKSSNKEVLFNIEKWIPNNSNFVPEDQFFHLISNPNKKSSKSPQTSSSILQQDIPSSDLVPNKLMATFLHHSDEIWVVKFSPNGKYVATASADCKIFIYEVENLFKQEDCHPMVCIGHSDSVSNLSWSHDSKFLASSSDDFSIRVWDPCSINDSKAVRCVVKFLDHKSWPSSVIWVPDNKHLISAGSEEEQVIKVFEIPKNYNSSTNYNTPLVGECVETWNLGYRVASMALCGPCGSISHNDEFFEYFEKRKEKKKAGKEQEMEKKENLKRKREEEEEEDHEEFEKEAFLKLSNQYHLVVLETNCLYVYENIFKFHEFSNEKESFPKIKRDLSFQIPVSEHLSSLSLSRIDNGRYALCNASGNTGIGLILIDLWEKKINSSYSGNRCERMIVRNAFGEFFFKNDDGIKEEESSEKMEHGYMRMILFSGSEDSVVYAWDKETGEVIGKLAGHDRPVSSVDFCPQRGLLASVSDDCTLKIWGFA